MQMSIGEVDKFLYVIYCQDDLTSPFTANKEVSNRFGGTIKRMQVYYEHKIYQFETSQLNSPIYILKIAAGPLESDCGKFMLGSLFIVQSTRKEAESFIYSDPFYKNHVWCSVNIHRYLSIPNGIKAVLAEKYQDDISTYTMVVTK